jgi:molybdopterin synthase sulfur carrier subunit
MSDSKTVTGITFEVVYLARLREAFGAAKETVTLPAAASDVDGLLAALRGRGGAWAAELAPQRPVRVAINHALALSAAAIHDGDEVALFPPVTGG